MSHETERDLRAYLDQLDFAQDQYAEAMRSRVLARLAYVERQAHGANDSIFGLLGFVIGLAASEGFGASVLWGWVGAIVGIAASFLMRDKALKRRPLPELPDWIDYRPRLPESLGGDKKLT